MLFRLGKSAVLGKFILSLIAIAPSVAKADFFQDRSHLINNNGPRLSYGIAVADLDGNNAAEFIVTGFGYPNLALAFSDGRLSNNILDGLFSDPERKTIGVAACDVDGDGMEEVYFLNTDAYSGEKVLADRLLDFNRVRSIYSNKETTGPA